MLSSRPASHYHAPHKENLYPSFSSKTPARGLAIHKDGPAAAGGGGARTVGKGAAAKTPFGRAGAGGGKGAMTTGRKGLGASLGPGRVGGQDAEGNIGAPPAASTRPQAPAPPPLPVADLVDHLARFASSPPALPVLLRRRSIELDPAPLQVGHLRHCGRSDQALLRGRHQRFLVVSRPAAAVPNACAPVETGSRLRDAWPWRPRRR